MRTPVRLAFVLIVALSSTSVLLAWGDTGHQLVGRIAARRLTPAARRGIVTLVRNAPDDDIGLKGILGHPGDPQPSISQLGNAMAKMATWPDCMGKDSTGHCNQKGVTGPWHFVDVGLFEGSGHLAERCGPESCVTEKIPVLRDNLKSGTDLVVVNEAETLTFHPDRELRFLIHFLGDVHQPLHTVTNADAGGNCVRTIGFVGVAHQLHATWDSGVVMLATAGAHGSPGSILNEFHSEEAAVSAVTDAAQIAGESLSLAKTSVYGKTTPPVPTIDHFVQVSSRMCSAQAPAEILAVTVDGPGSFDNEGAKKLVREQLFKAGVRLAAILNAVFS